MEMGIWGWLISGIAVFITGVSKSGLGGALGALAVPLMSIWIGPKNAVAVMLPVLVATDLFGFGAWRGKANARELKILLPGAVAGIVIGAVTFKYINDSYIRILIGVIAILFSFDRILRLLKSLPSMPVSESFGRFCGIASGFTSTVAHAGGPPLLLYLLNRNLDRFSYVATTVYFFTAVNLIKLPFYLAVGVFGIETLAYSLCLLPIVPLGVICGQKIVNKIPEKPFFLIASLVLGVAGLKLLYDGAAAII